MKRNTVIIALAFLALCSCSPKEQKVMARFVPERADDFVFENDLVAGRIYGQALEGNPTSPGIDVWVKIPGGLVANEMYRQEKEEHKSYHKFHGLGKDCYKVATSLGAGASSPLIDGKLCYPATNYRSWDILTEKPEKIVFALHYPSWEASEGISVSLDKVITVTPGTNFLKCDDIYTFSGTDSLTIAAGVFRHAAQQTIEWELVKNDRYALWEKASDTGAEPEEGRIGVGVYVPGAESTFILDDQLHGVCTRTIRSGEKFSYYFGSCWSRGNVSDHEEWFSIVEGLE